MLTLVTPPAAIFTAANLKAQLRVDGNEEDTMINDYIAAATAYLDGPNGKLNQALMAQTWLWQAPCFASPLRLPFGPALQRRYFCAWHGLGGRAGHINRVLWASGRAEVNRRCGRRERVRKVEI